MLKKNERMKIEIERDRKGIEFWFAALAIMTTIVAAIGALFPYLMTRKDKELLKVELAGVKNDRTDIQRMKDDVQKDKAELQIELQNAKDTVASIRYQHSSAEKSATSMSNLLAEFSSANKPSEAEKVEVTKQAESIANDPNASQIDKLRARAVEASQHEKPTLEQAEIAFDLWKAIAVENPQDDNALVNSAYWAGITAELSETVNKIHWLHQAQKLNEQTLKINPKERDAANNWGVALGKEADEVAKSDLKAAQTLWQQAGEKFELALKINPEESEALYNWGVGLGKIASIVAKTDLKAAQSLWQQAGEKYALSLKINPEKYEAACNWGVDLSNEAEEVAKTDLKAAQILREQAVRLLEKHTVIAPEAAAYNLACFFSRLERFNESLTQLETARLHDDLPSHWLNDSDLENLRQTDEYKTWYKTHFGEDMT
jgi:Plant specific mitochondrial import receptor subunit TOM20